ncbi:MAG: NapC/NirT family cytochrome c [Rhodospirillales bacterium]|nr:NapC/NirT family cytochrome c [Rhodospirillales bacterium]MDK9720312.1 NapC/NirT family cytochrome c [Rhodospirillales bacterium]
MSNPEKSGWRRLWPLLKAPSPRYALGVLLLVGGIGGVMAWGAFNWALELTNTEAFCITCHEMKVINYAEFQGTVHDANKSGVRATCPDCHVPKEWIYKVRRKIQASNELFHHFLGTVDTPEKFEAKRLQLAVNVWRAMKETDSRECRNCHNFEAMDISRQNERAHSRHLDAVQDKKTCIDCHKGVAHHLPKGTFEAEEMLNKELGGK